MTPMDMGLESLLQEGRWELLRELLEQRIASARTNEDPKSLAELLSLSAVVHAVLCHQKSALRDAEEAVAIRQRLGRALDTARALAGLAAAQADQNGPRAALEYLQKALGSFRSTEELAERCHAGLALAGLQLSVGKTREARDVADEAIVWCADDGLAWCKWTLIEVKADAFEADKDYHQALTCREQAFLLRQRENAVSSDALWNIAKLYRQLGRLWEAEQMLGMAREYAREEFGARKDTPVHLGPKKEGDRPGLKRGRLTLPGLNLPGWERTH